MITSSSGKVLRAALIAGLLLTAGPAFGDISVGGITFEDNAFADSLASSVGDWSFGGGASSLEDALVGSNPADYAFAFGSSSNVVLLFTDNAAINLPGPDLAVFELGTVESFSLAITVGGTTKNYAGTDTGFDAGGFDLIVALIDLDDFGVPANGLVSTVQLFPDPRDTDPADFTVVAAINNAPPIPEPASTTLGLLGLGTLGFVRRRLFA